MINEEPFITRFKATFEEGHAQHQAVLGYIMLRNGEIGGVDNKSIGMQFTDMYAKIDFWYYHDTITLGLNTHNLHVLKPTRIFTYRPLEHIYITQLIDPQNE